MSSSFSDEDEDEDSECESNFLGPKSKVEHCSHRLNAHCFKERLHANFSTKSWGFEGIGFSKTLFNPLARRVVFSHISHRQEPCGMFLLKAYSL